MTSIPQELENVLDVFSENPDRHERTQLLMYWADQFKEVPETIATKPFPEENRVPSCESQAFVFKEKMGDGKLKFHFAVDNPQGLSAKAVAALLHKTVSEAPLEQVRALDPEIIFTLFGNKLGMVRAEGLRGMVKMVRAFAVQELGES